MTLAPKKLEGLDLRDAKFLEIIDKNGWHVMSVAPRVGEHGAIFSYPTGLFLRFKHPEIILCGLEPGSSIRIINEIGRQVQSGKTFEVSQPYSDIFADDVNKCQFRPVQVALYGEYACWTQWFYEERLSRFAVLLARQERALSLGKDCQPAVANCQPLFYPHSPTVL
jgi:Domain of unknown function (DUF4262)